MRIFMILIVLLFLSCQRADFVEFDNYLDSVKVGQVLDVNNKWINLDTQTQEYNIYKECNSYSCEATIKVKNDTIIEIKYRIARKS